MTRHLLDKKIDRVFEEGKLIGINVEMVFWNEQVDKIEVVFRKHTFADQTIIEEPEEIEEEAKEDAFLE